MKQLFLSLLVLTTFTITAQERHNDNHDKKEHQKRMAHFSNLKAEDIAQLKTKKMTLALDLTAEQQEQVYLIHLEQTKMQKAKYEARKQQEKGERKKLTHEERLAMVNERLDRQIALKSQFKQILNATQYEKFERMLDKRQLKKHQKRKAKKREHKDN